MKTIARVLVLLYWSFAYFTFLVSFLYLVGFTANHYTFSSVDSGLQIPPHEAAATDLGLIALFGLQHSIMARRGFKRIWTRVVPWPMERATFLLATSIVLAILFFKWEPIPGLVWSVDNPVGRFLLQALFWAGWGLVGIASFSIGHFDKFGWSQVRAYLRGEREQTPEFKTPGPYRWLRHPMMLGLLLGFWFTPEMSQGHLLLAVGITVYILIGVWFEERDLLREHGALYEDYRKRVGMLFPRP